MLKHKLLEGIADQKDYDQIDIEKEIKIHQAWREYQLNLLDSTLSKPVGLNMMQGMNGYKIK